MRIRFGILFVSIVLISLGIGAVYFADSGFGLAGGLFLIGTGLFQLFSARFRVFLDRNNFRPEVDAEDAFVLSRESIIDEVFSSISISIFVVSKLADTRAKEIVYFEKQIRRFVALIPFHLSRKESPLIPQQVIGWGLAYFSPMENRWIVTPFCHIDQRKTVDSLIELFANDKHP